YFLPTGFGDMFRILVGFVNRNQVNADGPPQDEQLGWFDLIGCKGYPEPHKGAWDFEPLLPRFADSQLKEQRYREIDPRANDRDFLAVALTQGFPLFILGATPKSGAIFRVTVPMQTSLMDYFWAWLALAAASSVESRGHLLVSSV